MYVEEIGMIESALEICYLTAVKVLLWLAFCFVLKLNKIGMLAYYANDIKVLEKIMCEFS